MELKVYQQDGSETGRSVALPEAVFGVEPNDHVLWLDVRRIQANARQGTHKAKERSEAVGSTRKLYRQKGTGFARAGSAKSPIRRSGGTIFGPKPHTYNLKVNRKTQQLARRSALTYKAQGEGLRMVEDFDFEAPSTAAFKAFLASQGVAGRRVLLLTAGPAPTLYRSCTNLAKVRVRPALEASTLDLLDAEVVLIQEGALAALTDHLAPAAVAG